MRVLNLDEAVQYYRDVMGLDYVDKTADGRVMFKGYDEFDHHSLTLREAAEPGLDYMGFKVESAEILEEYAKQTAEFGLKIEAVPAQSDQPGFGKRYAVDLPTGHRIDLYSEVELAADHPELTNPNIWQHEPKGIGVTGFDHALLFGPNAKDTVRYFTDVLGLSIVEIAKAPDGENNLCVWLTGNNKAHDVAVLEFPEPGKIHHFAFKLESWNDIGRAADLMSINNIKIDAGPMRHGVTRGQTIYFFDPSGNRNEVYAGGYAHFPDMPVRVWDFDHVGKGIFYYSRTLNDAFLTVVT
jgi:catechol 2,3-dioxygenase